MQRNVATEAGHMISSIENHVTPTERRVENGVKQTILLPNFAVGKTITQDKDVRLVDDDVDQKVFNTQDISAVNLDDSQLVTLKLESENYLRFQPNTEAQCGLIPIDLYNKASKDYQLKHVKPANTQVAA